MSIQIDIRKSETTPEVWARLINDANASRSGSMIQTGGSEIVTLRLTVESVRFVQRGEGESRG